MQALPDPAQVKTTITLDPDKLAALVQLIERIPCHDEQYQTIGIRCEGREAFLLGKDQGEAPWTSVPVPGGKVRGESVTVFVDRRHLTKALDFGLCTVAIIDESSPLRFHQGGRQMIIMPVRTTMGPVKAPVPGPQPPEQTSGSIAATERPPATTHPIERKRMNDHPHQEPATPPNASVATIEEAITATNSVREVLQRGLDQLRDLSARLKSIHREQRTSEREFNSMRSTLRSLQSLKL